MRFEAIESISPFNSTPGAPIVLEQSTSRLSAIANAMILLPASAAMLAPFGLVASLAAAQPDIISGLVDKPVAALQLLIALAACAALVAVSVRRLMARLARGARIEITPESVRVQERGVLSAHIWSAPLASYAGVTHRVRSTLSGNRHELHLVHPEPAKSLLIEIAPRIAATRLAEVAGLLRLPVLAADAGAVASALALGPRMDRAVA